MQWHCGGRPRLQRRDRNGFAPFSLFFGRMTPPADTSNARKPTGMPGKCQSTALESRLQPAAQLESRLQPAAQLESRLQRAVGVQALLPLACGAACTLNVPPSSAAETLGSLAVDANGDPQ
jgi:hypothetical protein